MQVLSSELHFFQDPLVTSTGVLYLVCGVFIQNIRVAWSYQPVWTWNALSYPCVMLRTRTDGLYLTDDKCKKKRISSKLTFFFTPFDECSLHSSFKKKGVKSDPGIPTSGALLLNTSSYRLPIQKEAAGGFSFSRCCWWRCWDASQARRSAFTLTR